MQTNGITNVGKRKARSEPFSGNPVIPIDLTLSDDEAEPAPKRHKSVTPIENIQQDAQRAKASSNVSDQHHVIPPRSPLPPPTLPSRNQTDQDNEREDHLFISRPKPSKPSPFGKKPSWAVGSSISIPRQRSSERSPSPLDNVTSRINGTASKKTLALRKYGTRETETRIVSLPGSDSDQSEPEGRSRPHSSNELHRELTEDTEPLKSFFESSTHQEDSRHQSLEIEAAPTQRNSQKAIINVLRRPVQPSPTLPLIKYPVRTTAPSSSNVEVRIPRTRDGNPSGDDVDILSRFQSARPNLAREVSERRALRGEIEASSEFPIKDRRDSIERLIGHNGFSETYDVEEFDEKRLIKLAQKKVKKIKRKDVALDFGVPIVTSEAGIELPVRPEMQVRVILDSRFDGGFQAPLTFTNDINNRQLSGKFQFTTNYILREKVLTTSREFNSGCRCVGLCNLSSCECLEKDVEVGRDSSGKAIMRREVIETYTRRPDGLVVLTDTYLDKYAGRSEITECNYLCGCGPSCLNKVVQKGRTVPLDIFQTAKCGFGVRSSSAIARGQFIELYLGEVVTQAALQQRENAKHERASSYTFMLDWWNDLQDHYHIDGEYFGSAMRFVNHSCNPNSRSITVQLGHHADKKVYYMAFFAVRDIKPGEEITIDYNPQLAKEGARIRDLDAGTQIMDLESEGSQQSDSEDAVDEDTVLCQCGALNCRVRLWPKARTQRKRRRRLRD